MAILCCTFFFTSNLNAQKQISGTVEDANGALAYVNVLLLQPSDSSLVTGNLTDEKGVFLLDDIEAGEYLLQTHMVGFQNQYSEKYLDGQCIVLLLTTKQDLYRYCEYWKNQSNFQY